MNFKNSCLASIQEPKPGLKLFFLKTNVSFPDLLKPGYLLFSSKKLFLLPSSGIIKRYAQYYEVSTYLIVISVDNYY